MFNISKILSGIMAVFFFISWSYSYEWAPLNFLSNWVDKVERDVEINGAKGKAILKNIYNESLEKAQLLEVNPMLDAVKQTTRALNDNYLCNLKDDDLVNILYIENNEFKKNIKNLSLNVSSPRKIDMSNSCSKLMGCVLKTDDSRKIQDSLSYCSLIVNDYYLQQYNNSHDLSSLSKGNEGYEAYRNNSLEDSNYDILYDISILSKIFFDSPEEPAEVLFYDLPDITPEYQLPQPEVVEYNKDAYSPYYVAVVRTGNSGGSGNGGSMGGMMNPSGNHAVYGDVGNDLQEFLYEVTYEVEGTEGSEFLGNDCVDGFEIDGIEGYAYTGLVTGYVSGTSMTPSGYRAAIQDQMDYFSCNRNGRCDIWESSDCSDCLPGDGGDPDPDGTGDNTGGEEEMTRSEKTKQCFRSCDDVPCKATNCDRLACYAKCVCISYTSDLYNPLENVGLSPAFKLEICAVPVLDSKVATTKKVSNLEMVINELYNVIWNLRNSGELQITKKTKEYLDAGFQNNNFSKQLSFMIEAYNKAVDPNRSEKQQMDDQRNLNTAMMEAILGFETSQDPSGQWRNKYVIKGGAIQNGALISTVKTGSYEEIDLMALQSALQSEHLSDMDSEVSEFLQSNLNFRFNVKDSFESLRDSAKTLANKK